MRRKINQVGTGTFTFSLPMKWAKVNKLKKGDELDVIEDRNKLIITSEGGSEENTSYVIQLKEEELKEIKTTEKILTRQLYNLYRKGANTIIIENINPEVIPIIEITLPSLMGFDIVKQSKDKCVLKNVAKVDSSEYDNIFRRLFLVTLELADESLSAIKNKEFESLDSIKKLEVTQNKLYMFCCRIVNVEGERKFKSPSIRYLLLHRLEDIADNYRDLCDYIIKNKISKIDENIIDYYEKTNIILRVLYDFYYKLDISHGDKILYEKTALLKEADYIVKKISKEQLPVFVSLRQIVYVISEAASPIYTILYDQNQ